MSSPTRPRAALLCALLMATPASAAQPVATPRPDEAARLVLARVNEDKLTLADLRASFAGRHEGHGGLLVGAEILHRVLEQAIQERLLIQEGRRMGMPQEPGFREAVADYRDSLKLNQLEQQRLQQASAATGAEVDAAYQLLGRLLHVAIIESRDRKETGEAAMRASMGEDFDTLARRLSDHPSRLRGGDLGWITWGALDPASEAVAFSTPVGRISDLFAVGRAWRVLRVIEERKGDPPPRADLEGRIRAIIEGRKRETARAQLIASIRPAHPPVENAAAIRQLLATPPEGAPAPQTPPDDQVLMKTATGLEITAGQVRDRAGRSGLSPAAAWDQASTDALMIDEARRSVPEDAAMKKQIAVFEDGRVREQVESELILKDIKIEDAEVRRYWETHQAAFLGPASYHMRHIVVADRDAAAQVARQLDAGEDFAALAKNKSQDAQTAGKGGDMGWVEGPTRAADGAPPEGVFALTPGQRSGPVHTSLGWSIVQVLEIRQPSPLSFEQARHAAAQRLTIQKQHDARDAFVQKLRAVSTVRTDAAAFTRAVQLQDEQAAKALKPRNEAASP